LTIFAGIRWRRIFWSVLVRRMALFAQDGLGSQD
jgi:hypothetical protein